VKKKKGTKSKRGAKSSSDTKYAWKLIATTAGKPKSKMVIQMEYHFCPNHNEGKGAWVIHNPA
jgi:hypothetical protein